MPDRQNHPAWDQIEPDVRFDPLSVSDRHNRPGEHEIELSRAISLKRIADVAEAWAQGAFNYPHKPNPLCPHGKLPLDCAECIPLP